MFSDEKLTEIRERVPIVELISEYVQLKKAGKNHKGLCPFHQEKTPSFHVSDEREAFHCFGCGAGGDIFHFVMKMEGLSFPEAVERLAGRAEIELEPSQKIDPARQRRKTRSYEINRQAAWYYHCLLKGLPREGEVWNYLTKRQITLESCEEFFLGYCPSQPSGLREHLKKKGFSDREINESGLFKGDREFFRGRLIFPIFHKDKKVAGFGGRLIHNKDFGPKYLNSPDSEIFKKGELFYGLNRAKEAIRKNNQTLVVEGYLDVITLHSHRLTHSVAPLGTALTNHQARFLHRMGGEITLLFDGDSAGQLASLRALEALLAQGTTPQAVHLSPGEDPDSFVRRHGRVAFEKKLETRRNLLEELIDKGSSSISGGAITLDQKGQTIRRILALIEKIPDNITLNLYRRRLAEAMEVPEEWLHQWEGSSKTKTATKPAKKEAPEWLPEEETIFEIWLKFPSLQERIREAIPKEDFCTEKGKEVAELFWRISQEDSNLTVGKYFDLAPSGLLEVLSELAVRPTGLEEENEAKSYLEQALLRLKEKRLRMDLRTLKGSATSEHIDLIQKKIEALSQVLKNKERAYGEGKP